MLLKTLHDKTGFAGAQRVLSRGHAIELKVAIRAGDDDFTIFSLLWASEKDSHLRERLPIDAVHHRATDAKS
jgi:hypothetical protein